MNKPTLYISCGLPGAGKSTFLKANKKEDEIIVSRDEIRFSLLKEQENYFHNEKTVFKIFIQTIGEELSKGKNVYADATHLNDNSRYKVLNNLKNIFPNLNFNIEIIYFNVPLNVCLERNYQREGIRQVPKDIIIYMSHSLNKPLSKYAKHLWIINENQEIEKEW